MSLGFFLSQRSVENRVFFSRITYTGTVYPKEASELGHSALISTLGDTNFLGRLRMPELKF
jgi:hypothetical protein